MIEGGNKVAGPILKISFLKPFSFSFGYKIVDNVYFETGGSFSEQKIYYLADKAPDPKGVGPKASVSLTYERKDFQLPLSITYTSEEKSSVYINIGVKCNFIYDEHLYGTNTSAKYYAANNTEQVDISDKTFKYYSITPNLNIGGVVWLMNKRLGFIYFGSMELQPLKKKDNAILKTSFYQFSVTNIKAVFNF